MAKSKGKAKRPALKTPLLKVGTKAKPVKMMPMPKIAPDPPATTVKPKKKVPKSEVANAAPPTNTGDGPLLEGQGKCPHCSRVMQLQFSETLKAFVFPIHTTAEGVRDNCKGSKTAPPTPGEADGVTAASSTPETLEIEQERFAETVAEQLSRFAGANAGLYAQNWRKGRWRPEGTNRWAACCNVRGGKAMVYVMRTAHFAICRIELAVHNDVSKPTFEACYDLRVFSSSQEWSWCVNHALQWLDNRGELK